MLFRSVYFTNRDQIIRFTKSLLYHMGPGNSSRKAELQCHVRHICLDLNKESITGHLEVAHIHHLVRSILPLLQSLKSFTYAMCHWDSFVVHRTIGHYIAHMAPLSLRKICLVVCSFVHLDGFSNLYGCLQVGGRANFNPFSKDHAEWKCWFSNFWTVDSISFIFHDTSLLTPETVLMVQPLLVYAHPTLKTVKISRCRKSSGPASGEIHGTNSLQDKFIEGCPLIFQCIQPCIFALCTYARPDDNEDVKSPPPSQVTLVSTNKQV
jgi:hypothetical protein